MTGVKERVEKTSQEEKGGKSKDQFSFQYELYLRRSCRCKVSLGHTWCHSRSRGKNVRRAYSRSLRPWCCWALLVPTEWRKLASHLSTCRSHHPALQDEDFMKSFHSNSLGWISFQLIYHLMTHQVYYATLCRWQDPKSKIVKNYFTLLVFGLTWDWALSSY